MANNNQPNLDGWVQQRLAALQQDSSWQPDTARAFAQMCQRLSAKSKWKPIAASGAALVMASLVIFLLASPQPRVLAQRCVDCSLALWESLNRGSTSAASGQIAAEHDRRRAIDFTLNDAAGRPVRLSSFSGRVVLLNFWATWCGGCKTEMPWFVDLQSEFHDRGLNAIGVAMDEDGWKSVTPYLAGHAVNYTIVMGNEQLGTRYGVQAMPVTMLIDRQGKIAVTHVGLVTESQYESEIQQLLSEKR
jgi:peroxiredoxin